MLLGGRGLSVVGYGSWVVGCGLTVVGLEVRNQWIVDGFSLLVTTASSASAKVELFYFSVSALIQKDQGKHPCNCLIIIAL